MNPVESVIARTGLSQSDLARICGVGRANVWAWKEKGRIPARNVPALCRATGLAPHEVSPEFPSPEELAAVRLRAVRSEGLAFRFTNLPPYALTWGPVPAAGGVSVELCSPSTKGDGQ